MDIFYNLSRKAIDDYLTSYIKEEESKFFYLDRKRITMKKTEKLEKDLSEENRNCIFKELLSFYGLAGNKNPFYYSSKLKFVDDHPCDDKIWTEELLLRLISDRCLYFYDRRRYACPDQGLHTLVERYRNKGFYKEEELKSAEEEVSKNGFEPMTDRHWDFYREYLTNYQKLQAALEKRRQFIKVDFLKTLNKVGGTRSDCKPEAFKQLGDKLTSIFQAYILSVIWKTSKKDYAEEFKRIFIEKDSTAFHEDIQSILGTISEPDGSLHWLSPLIVYHIFTGNMKRVLTGGDSKLWKGVSRCSKLAKIPTMNELTGRKAGVNLALFCQLCSDLGGFCNIPLNLCGESSANVMTEDKQTARRDALDFLFYLTTGYGALFHCDPRHFQTEIDLSEMAEKYKWDKSNADFPTKFAVYLYSPDYQHPVDELGHLLKFNIEACFANRSEFLTPGVYAQMSRSELAMLADLILQDMALPAAERLSRHIQKTTTESPEILDCYKPFLCDVYASGKTTECLEEIMRTYFADLEGLMIRYQNVESRYGIYSYRNILRAMVEFEIRHSLYAEGSSILKCVAKRVINKSLFVTDPFS